jgi:23S rRNA (cytosine1962-C5)-methyltransferase
MQNIYLKPGREKSVLQGHPWIFSGGIGRVDGSPEVGETVAIRSAGGEFLAWAAYSPISQIRARVWSLKESEVIDRKFLSERLAKSLAMRAVCIPAGETNALRLVHGESDGIPGLVVDRYGDILVAQFLSAGVERCKDDLADLLMELTGAVALYERSDADVRRLEGLQEQVGLLRGVDPGGPVMIQENGLKFQVDFRGGQKTGFYIDQRYNRARLGQMAAGRDVLNCFCYTGGFTAYALAGGAKSVLSLDSSGDALELAKQNIEINNLPAAQAEWMDADVFHALRLFRDQGKSFDMIILDPPKFAPTAAQAERAARGYKDINLLAIKLLRPGGLLFTFSCSGGISAELFQKIVAGAGVDANATVSVIEHLEQGVDHPVSLNFPEGAYLKGLVCWKA